MLGQGDRFHDIQLLILRTVVPGIDLLRFQGIVGLDRVIRGKGPHETVGRSIRVAILEGLHDVLRL